MSTADDPRPDATMPTPSLSNRVDDVAAADSHIAAAPPSGKPDLAAMTRPLDVDGTTTVAIGTALWAVAGLVLVLFFRDDLADDGRQWWLWTCLAGFGMGLLGWVVCRRRRDRLIAARRS